MNKKLKPDLNKTKNIDHRDMVFQKSSCFNNGYFIDVCH
jgi:hypothetical protein